MSTEWAVERLVPEEDLEAVLAIEAASFSNPWTRDMFLAELAHAAVSRTYVIRTPARRVAGFCMIWIVLEDVHVNNLAVDPACRRQGLARALLVEVLKDAVREGATRATLEVRRSNVAALALYEQLGFRVVGVRRDYYACPVEDALVLWLEPLSALTGTGSSSA